MHFTEILGACFLLRGRVVIAAFEITNFLFPFILQATLLALKADLSAKESNSQGQDYVEAAATISLGTTKPETEEAVTNPRRNCGKSCTRESDARPSNIQNQVPKWPGVFSLFQNSHVWPIIETSNL